MKTISVLDGTPEISAGETGRPHRVFKNWLRLACGVLFIILFMFFLAPWMQKIPAIKTLSQYISESGIDAGALYYTEVEEVGEADLGIRNTLRFYLPEK